MAAINSHDKLLLLLQNADEQITHPQNAQYNGKAFTLNNQHIFYRKAKITPDRPGAFLALWKRSEHNSRPSPFTNEFDYLLVEVSSDGITTINNQAMTIKRGLFIFPMSVLLDKGIVAAAKQKGKTAFRVFPPWSESRALNGSGVFSHAAKKTQRWQCSYFIEYE